MYVIADWRLVRAALENPEIHVVTFDWLEDSLMSKTKKPKRMTDQYRWDIVEEASEQKSELRRSIRQQKVNEKGLLSRHPRTTQLTTYSETICETMR